MCPPAATGALDPASIPSLSPAFAPHPPDILSAAPPDPALDMGLLATALRLSRHMVEALGQCRRQGHKDPRVSLTRPSRLAELVRCLLLENGLDAAVAPAGLPGHMVLTLRG